MKKQLYILFCVVGFVLVSVQSSFATHVVGGNLTYKCLGNDLYEVTLEFRRDCFLGDPGAQFDDPVSIGIFDSNGVLVTSAGLGGELFINFSDDDTLNEMLTSECAVLGSDVCVQTTTYRSTVELPFLSGGYILAYQRCCRNQSLINILDPNDFGGTYWTEISEESLNTCNSSPVFNEWPTIYLCVNEPLLFDHGATDAEGDSLVYRLCLPHDGASPDPGFVKPQPPNPPPYGNIFWAPGFSLDNVMGGDPLSIDSITGVLTGSPTVVGQFLIAVCVEEYRDGELIGMTYRDFEYNTRICERNPIAEFEPDMELNCDDFEVAFENMSTEGSDAIWYFDYPNTDLSSTDFDPTFQYPEGGLYQVALFVTKGVCTDSTFLEIGVASPNDFNLDFNVDYETCQDELEINLEDLSTINQTVLTSEYLITGPDTSFTIPTSTTSIVLDTEGSYTITLQVLTESGCDQSLEEAVDFDISSEMLLPVIGDGNLCGSSFSLNVDLDADVEWFLDEEMTQTLGSNNPINLDSDDFTLDDTLYVVELGANCPNFTAVPLDIVPTNEQAIELLGQGNICDEQFTLLALNIGIEVEWFLDPGMTESLGTMNPIDLLSENFTINDTIYISQTNTICPNRTAVPLDIVPLNEDILLVEGAGNFCEEEFSLMVMNDGEFVWYSDSTATNEIGNTNPIVLDPADFLVGDTLYVVQTSTICPNITAVPLVLITNEGTLDLEEAVLTCKEDIVELNPGGNPDYTYSWTSEPDGVLLDPTEVNPSVNVVDTTVFYVEAVVNGSCIILDTITINPQILSVELESDTVYYCMDETIIVEAIVEGAIGVTWVDENNEIVGGGASFTYSPEGTEVLTVFATNQIACDESAMLTLIPYEFEGEISGDNISCIGEEITLMVDYEDPLQSFTYTWFPEDVFGANTTGTSQTNMYTATTDVTVTVENQIGCAWEINYTVTLDPFDSFEVNAEPDDILFTESTQLMVDDLPGASYQWEPEEFLDDATIPNPIATPTENVVFTVTVTNENGCIATDTVSVRVVPPVCDDNDIFVPNTFTPNGDGLNDFFKVESNFIDEIEMIVYNRWGEEVYSTTDPDTQGWDGTFENTELEADVYGYHLRILCIGGEEFVTQGNISILK